jgi:hypothetical protein
MGWRGWHLLVVAILEKARVGRVGDVERHDGQSTTESENFPCIVSYTRQDTQVWGVGDIPFGELLGKILGV